MQDKISQVLAPKDSQPLLAGSKIEIPDVRYKADLELHDRFQNFSAELMRLSLGGMTVIGGFLSILSAKNGNTELNITIHSKPFFRLVLSSLIGFALALLFALLHRFLASDGMYHHLRAIKLLILKEQPDANPHLNVQSLADAINAEACEDETMRNKKFARSEQFLWLSAIFLFLGAILLGIAFLLLIK